MGADQAELFEEREYTEAELTGETVPDPPPADPAAPPVPPDPGAADPGKPAEPAAESGKEPPPPETPAAKKEDRVVPYAALHEERLARQRSDAENKALKAKLAEAPAKEPNVLEDPEGAFRALQERVETLQQELLSRDMETRIKAEVPDFFDQAPVMEKLLQDEGMSEDAIRSMIGSVGVEAPTLFKVLSKLTKSPDPAALRTQLTAELTPAITAQVTRNLMEKFKIVDSGTNLDRLPGAPADGKIIVDGEKEFAKLSPEMQEKWLRGE